MVNFKILQTWTTDQCADSVEWCPILSYQHYFVCGTYELKKSSQNENVNTSHQIRLGQILLFSIIENLNLYLHSVTESSGILDIKWCPKIICEKILLITANADGSAIIYSLQNDENSKKTLKIISTYTINSEHTLILSVDWSDCENDPIICISDSQGSITVLRLDSEFNLILLRQLRIHDYEAWTVVFDFWNDSILYSGADDCLLKIIDLRTDQVILQQQEHTSGVTSLRFNHLKENILASGSYDETIKIWDTRQMKKSLSSIEVGGGIWRIKWDPFHAENILTAAMYSGVFLLKYSNETYSLEIESELKEHESIAYGIDFCHLPSEEINTKCALAKSEFVSKSTMLTASCSFYDKKLCLSLL